MPLPYLVERADEVSANWRIGTPSACPNGNGCDALIGEIAAQLWPQLELHDPTAVAIKAETPTAPTVAAITDAPAAEAPQDLAAKS